MNEVSVITGSPGSTKLVAAAVAAHLLPGDRLLLLGDLGGGKTTFTRGLLEGLGHPDPREVASPSYALHHRYEGGRLPVDHLDLYRLEGGEHVERQGVLDCLDDAESVSVIEWAERLSPGKMATPVTIEFSVISPTERGIRLSWPASLGIRFGPLALQLARVGATDPPSRLAKGGQGE